MVEVSEGNWIYGSTGSWKVSLILNKGVNDTGFQKCNFWLCAMTIEETFLFFKKILLLLLGCTGSLLLLEGFLHLW